jgi:Na+/melibiose symporter-like transporter
MKDRLIFESLAQWWGCTVSAFRHIGKGVARLLYAIVIGIVSLFVWIGKQIEAFCKREPVAAGIIAAVFLLMSVGWIYTFTRERHATVVAQHKADSLAYDLSRITQFADTDNLMVENKDTLRYE